MTIIGLAASALWLTACGDKDEQNQLELQGNVDVRQVSVAFDQSGRIAELRADEGEAVKAGTVLGLLDTVSQQLQADRAKAQANVQEQNLRRLRNGSRPEEIAQAAARLTSVKAEAERAATELARLRGISDATQGRGVAAQELDRADKAAVAARAGVREQEAALRLVREGPRPEDIAASQAQVEAARAEIAFLEYQIEQGVLRAPVDGVIRSRLLEPGDIASPQRPAYTLALIQPKWVRVYVAEPDLGRLRPGMPASVISDSQPDRPISGQIGYISSVAEFTPKTVQTKELRTSLVYEVRVTVEDPENRLRLGQPVTVRIDLTGGKR
jgi:HlyD family secretion protein